MEDIAQAALEDEAAPEGGPTVPTAPRIPAVPPSKPAKKDRKQQIDDEIEAALAELSSRRQSFVYPLLLGENNLDYASVDDVFDDLRTRVDPDTKKLDVIVHSGGGSIHAAYSLALLFRRYARERLTFIVPRWAKSAATLLVCAGDEILMGPISELGPVDPQITTMNPLERRFEQVTPLSIKATLDLIRTEFAKGHKDLANGLLQRLQFPLTLGEFKRSLEIGKVYLTRLLSSRMLKGDAGSEKARKIAESLVEGYADHGYCIEAGEAERLGIAAKSLDDAEFDIAWKIYRLSTEKERIVHQEKRQEMEDLLKGLPLDGRS